MRWLVTGGGGQLASQLEARLVDEETTVLGVDELDITDAAAIGRVVADVRPDVVVNAAAYTAVDDAEADDATATEVNEKGPRRLAAALSDSTARLIHVSTDYVFGGDATTAYETDAIPDPRTVYGSTKLAGEVRVRAALPERSYVVRTAWVYGGPTPNFVDTMRRLEGERDTLDVVADQIGCPTWSRDLADALIELGRSDVPGSVLHYVNAGQASWYDLACEVFRLIGADPARVRPTDSTSFSRPAPRPAWSVLSTRAWSAAGLTAPRPWQDALAEYLG